VHVPLGENEPEAPPLLKVTVPPGLDFVPLSVSVTVAVQVVVFHVGRVASEQLTNVLVLRRLTVMLK
jgi:hypothetical protein